MTNVEIFDSWFYRRHKNEFISIRRYFTDEMSIRTLDAVMKTMDSGDSQYVADIAVPNQYFCVPGFMHTLFDIFVDVGTCTGDTIERFLWAMTGNFRKIYAFEPGDQIHAAQQRKKRLIQEWGLKSESIVIENMGVGCFDGYAKFIQSSFKESNSIKMQNVTNIDEDLVKICTIDSYFKDKEVTFIKADLEGSEVDLLRGAKDVITSQKPKLAICVYHRPDDLFNIINILHQYVPEYRFYLRHHSSLSVETVLYCIV